MSFRNNNTLLASPKPNTTSSPFDPASYGTLRLWLDASDNSTISSTSGNLDNWANKVVYPADSVDGVNSVGSSPVAITTLDIGQVMRFTATSSRLQAGTSSAWKFLHSNDATILVVIRPNYLNSNTGVILTTTSTNSTQTGIVLRTNTNFRLTNDIFGSDPSPPAYNPNYVATITSDTNYINPFSSFYCLAIKTSVLATASQRMFFFKNGINAGYSNAPSATRSLNDPLYVLTIGGVNVGSPTMDIAEVLIYETALLNEDIAEISASLMSKWNSQLW